MFHRINNKSALVFITTIVRKCSLVNASHSNLPDPAEGEVKLETSGLRMWGAATQPPALQTQRLMSKSFQRQRPNERRGETVFMSVCVCVCWWGRLQRVTWRWACLHELRLPSSAVGNIQRCTVNEINSSVGNYKFIFRKIFSSCRVSYSGNITNTACCQF